MPRPNTQDIDLRFITRTHDQLWRVWVTFGALDLGQMYFSDRAYGTTAKALRAAKRYRDSAIKQHEIPLRIYAGNGFCIKNSRNSSGTVGIVLALDNPDSPTKVNWVVRIMVNGKQRSFGRSVLKHGYVEAWRMVADVRRHHTMQPTPDLPPPPPDWLAEWLATKGVEVKLGGAR